MPECTKRMRKTMMMPSAPHNLEEEQENVWDNLVSACGITCGIITAIAVSAPNIFVPALHEHDYLQNIETE